MAMTLTDFQTAVRLHVKRTTTGLSDANLLIRINWALDYIASAYTFEEMRKDYSFTCSITSRYYTFPTNMKDIYDIRIDASAMVRLKYIQPRDFDQYVPDPAEEDGSEPVYYVDYGTRWQIHPMPATAYTGYLKCSIFPTALATGTDTPLFTKKDRLITAVATAMTFETLQEDELALSWWKIAQMELQMAIKADHSAEDWEPVARPFSTQRPVTGQPWKQPFSGLPY